MNALLYLGLLAFFIHGVFVDSSLLKIYFPLVALYWILSVTVLARNDAVGKRRKITISSWGEPTDPSCYLPVEYDVTDLLEHIEAENKKGTNKAKLTLTYSVTKALGVGFNFMKNNVGRIAFGQYRTMKQVDIAILADVKGGKDLVPMTIKTPFSKSVEEIALEIKEKASRAKSGKDDTHNKNFAIADFVPSFLLGPVIGIGSYLALNCGYDIPIIGAKGDQYPPLVLTNVGSFGLEAGFAPIPPTACMICSCMGTVTEKPWIVNGEIKIRKILTIVHTLDHRAGDAALIVKPFKIVKKLLESPGLLESLEYDGDTLKNPEILDLKKNN